MKGLTLPKLPDRFRVYDLGLRGGDRVGTVD